MLRSFVCAAAVMVAVPAAAEVSIDDQAAIRTEITDQIADFGRGDAQAAFAHASPGIRTIFGSADVFLNAIGRSYQPLIGPRAVTFDIADDRDGQVVQLVSIVARDGRAYVARYMLERQPDGRWRISGCELLSAQSAGT